MKPVVDSDMDFMLSLQGGIRLSYARYGRRGGVPAFYFHGLPGSRREGELLHEACLASGVDLIAPDRPGFGCSDAMQGERVAQWPAVIEQLASHLGMSAFYLFAVSGGAPYALSVASRLPSQVNGTAICCGMAEVARAQVRAEMRFNARLGFWLARRGAAWLNNTYGRVLTPAARWLPGWCVDAIGWLDGPEDRAVLRRSDMRRLFAANLREAFRQGAAGGVADMCAANRPWPFDLKRIGRLHLWHGLADRVVPPAHSRWLAAAVPEARLELVEGEGHFSLPINHAGGVVDALLAGD